MTLTGRLKSLKRRFVRSVPSAPAEQSDSVFDVQAALEINGARMSHLAALSLPLTGKRVLEVGAGVGKLTGFFLDRGCAVTSIDGRVENLEQLREQHPDVITEVVDVERDDLSALGSFDVVFCYGLLYHLEDPFRAVGKMSEVCSGTLLLETMVCDHSSPVLKLEAEPPRVPNQALRGVGSRPSPAYVVMALRLAGFEYVYAPNEPPAHRDFLFVAGDTLDTSRDGHPLRRVFVASRQPLSSQTLSLLL
jgi:SAM-dependent methyltransferase